MATSLSNALAGATAKTSTLDDPDTAAAGTIATASNPFAFLLLTQESAMSANLVVAPAQYKSFTEHLRLVESGWVGRPGANTGGNGRNICKIAKHRLGISVGIATPGNSYPNCSWPGGDGNTHSRDYPWTFFACGPHTNHRPDPSLPVG